MSTTAPSAEKRAEIKKVLKEGAGYPVRVEFGFSYTDGLKIKLKENTYWLGIVLYSWAGDFIGEVFFDDSTKVFIRNNEVVFIL